MGFNFLDNVIVGIPPKGVKDYFSAISSAINYLNHRNKHVVFTKMASLLLCFFVDN